MPTIGGYELHSIETGTVHLDGGAMFGVVPKALWSRKYPVDGENRIPLAMRSLLLKGHERIILIDSGLGHKYNNRFREIYNVDHETHTLDASLKAVGVSAEEVTDVILTHLHFDHCGGCTRREGESLAVVFDQARHWVRRDHWDWAHSGHPRERASFLDENLRPLEESGQLQLMDGDEAIAPAISTRAVNGHTTGQQIVLIRDAHQTLAYMADLVPTAAHLAVLWNMGYDLYPMTSIEEKSAILPEAAREGWSLFLEHDAQTEVVSVEQTQKGFRPIHHRFLADLD